MGRGSGEGAALPARLLARGEEWRSSGRYTTVHHVKLRPAAWLATAAVLLAAAPPGAPAPPDNGAAASLAAPLAPKLEPPLMRGQGDLPDLEPPAEPLPQESLGWQLFRTMLVLGIVVVLIYLTMHLGLRRLLGVRGLPGRASVVSVLERVPLDHKRSLFVVRAAGEYLLVGAGEGPLNFIAKLDAAEVERLQREKPSPGASLSPFLQKLLTRRGGTPPPRA
ncbi:MAG: FliO/MopB family protein [Myxococcales bacterium]|nr:FliO/MopB family protein [Myxococcales bacterium]